MALSYVGGTSGSGTTATYAVSLSGTLTGGSNTSPSTGDIIVVVSAFGNTASSAPTCTGNNSGAYTGAHTAMHVNDTWDSEFRTFYMVQGGTVDTSLTIGRAANAAYGGATVVQVWRGVNTTTPIDTTTLTASAGNASTINPPAITPVTAGAVIIAGGCGTQGTTGSAFVVPSGMTNGVTVNADGTTSDIGVMIASYSSWTSGSYDPAAVTGGSTSTSSSWAASTLVLRPYVAPVDNTLTCAAGSYTLAGVAATLLVSHNLALAAGAYTYSGIAATLDYVPGTPAGTAYTLTCAAGSYTYTGVSSTLHVARNLPMATGSYSYTGTASQLTVSRPLALASGSYSYTGVAATLDYVAGTPPPVDYTLDCATDSYTLTGIAATLSLTRGMPLDSGAYVYTGIAAALDYSTATDYTIVCNAGSYVYAGTALTFTIAGSPVWPLPAEVAAGVIYGPTGWDYVGTLVAGIQVDVHTGTRFKAVGQRGTIALL